MQRWKLVPIEPTEEMLDAARLGWVIRPAELKKRVRIYKAMVNAAPGEEIGREEVDLTNRLANKFLTGKDNGLLMG